MKRVERPVVCVLLSGGIDSTACTHFYLQRKYAVRPLFVAFGQPAESAEFKSAESIAKFYKLKLSKITVAGFKIPTAGEITGRNLFLISVALMRAGIKANLIGLGIHAGTRYFDCNPDFVQACSVFLAGYTDGRVQLGVPFLTWAKPQIWSYCRQYGVPTELTWSCEASSSKACGKCLSCRDKELLIARA